MGQNGPSKREACLDLVARAARGARFDEDRRGCDLGHQRVASREVPASHRRAYRERGDDQVLACDARLQRGVLARIGICERGTDDGEGAASRVHRGLVRDDVDAGGETGGDRDAAGC